MLSIRKIGVITRTYRHFNRYRQILSILFRYGFGNIVDSLNIDQYIEIGLQLVSRNRRERVEKLTSAIRVRLIFEELGPTFIKFGQILSTRPDLIPVNFTKELEKLQDNVPSFPFDDVKKIILQEFAVKYDELYEQIDKTPIASASIGQVHVAKLKNGEKVAVKIQRPDICDVIEVDLEIMLHLATLIEKHVEEFAFYCPVKIVEEFAKTISNELDYTIEASSMDRVAKQFFGNSSVYIPKAFREKTTQRILTMEYVDGIKISDIEKLDAAGIDRKFITKSGANFILQQVFMDGFFHADLHPGNIFVLRDNVLCPIDFGMMGFVDMQTRETFFMLIESIANQNASVATRSLLKLTQYDNEPDLRTLERDIADFMNIHFSKTLKNLNMGKLLQDILDITFRHRLRLYPDTFLMMKSFAAVEGVALILDPEFDMIKQAVPFIKNAKFAKFSPEKLTEEFVNLSSSSIKFLQQFPLDFLDITKMIRQRKFTVGINIRKLEKMLEVHDKISNRLCFSIIMASLIIGSSLLLNAKVPPFIFGLSSIGVAGFMLAGVMGIWICIAVLKRGRL